MKLQEMLDLAIEMGRKCDLRGEYLDQLMENKLQEYESMSAEKKVDFDRECLENPFNDTRILVGTGEEEIRHVLCGIDMETPELLLADRLRQKGNMIDLIIAHHPEGVARADLHQVMDMQADLLAQHGVPINIAEAIMTSRISEVERGLLPLNHQRTIDAARLLDMPFMCVHTPADNLVNDFLQKMFALREDKTLNLGNILDMFQEIPEYAEAKKIKVGPKIIVGDAKKRAGKIFIKMTGGTTGSEKAYENLARAGVGTIIGMHMQEKHRQAAQENNINVIIAGHMASDSLGLNLYLDELEKRGIEITPCAGLIRVKRF